VSPSLHELVTSEQYVEAAKYIAADIIQELSAYPARWCQGALGRFIDDRRALFSELWQDDVVCWCLLGHFYKRLGGCQPVEYDVVTVCDKVFEVVRRELGGKIVGLWNDARDRTVQDVIALCRRIVDPVAAGPAQAQAGA